MFVRPYDRPSMLALFDEYATVVFAAASRLVDRDDAAVAFQLLVDAYRHVAATVDATADGLRVDRSTLIDATHVVWLGPADRADRQMMAELAVASLRDVEGRSMNDVASILGLTDDEATACLAAARRQLQSLPGGSTADSLRGRELWLDDETRAAARDMIGAHRTEELDRTTVVPPARRARRRAPTGPAIALVAVTALIIALAVRATRTDGEHSTSSTSTSTTSTSTSTSASAADTTAAATAATAGSTSDTTTPISSTDDSAVEPVGRILDPVPAGYSPLFADTVASGTCPGVWFELWATPEVTRTSGRWLALLVTADRDYQPLTPDTAADGSTMPRVAAVYSTDADGVEHVFVTAATGQPLEIAAFGHTHDQLVQVVDDTSVDASNRSVFGQATSALFDGMDLRVGRYLTCDGTSVAQYVGADNTIVAIESVAQTESDLLMTQLLGTPLSLAASQVTASTMLVGGRVAIVGQTSAPTESSVPATQFVQWHEGGDTVTITGTTGVDALLGLASTLRLATPDEWNQPG